MNVKPNLKFRVTPQSTTAPALVNAINAELAYLNDHAPAPYRVGQIRLVPGGAEVWMHKYPIPAFAKRRKGWGIIKVVRPGDRDAPVYKETADAAPPIDPDALAKVIDEALTSTTKQKLKAGLAEEVAAAVLAFLGGGEATT